MIDPKLQKVCEEVDEWCSSNNVKYDIVCDETDLQGIMLFKRDRSALSGLLDHLKQTVVSEDIHMEMRKVRGGNIIAFSLKAISEDQINSIIEEAGEEEVAMSFLEKIDDAFDKELTIENKIEPKPEDIDFANSAKEIAESQRKSATGGMTRANQSSRQRQSYETDSTYGGAEHPASPKASKSTSTTKKRRGPVTGPPTRFESFDKALNETLSGMATATGAQPGDLFNKFARALQVLGKQIGIGPLQDQLKQQGIQWKKSNDGMAIILYVKNATTGRPQPIARVTSETLENPRDFEDQLTNMLDFSKGEAPGTLRQKQQEMKDQEGAIRDIAQAISPESEESEVAQQMNQPQMQQPQIQQPQMQPQPQVPQVQPQPQPEVAAAATAASPKPAMKQRSGLV